MENLLLSIRQSFYSFSPAEKRIASYIINADNETLKLSIEELAKRCDTSRAAVVRFCKTLGLGGFKEFRIALTNDMLRQIQQGTSLADTVEDITGNENIDDIVSKVVNQNIRSILDTQKTLDTEQLSRAVEILNAARRIEFFGVGASGLVAQDACQKFIRIGKNCSAWPDPHIQLTAAASLTAEDAGVVISYSGMTNDMLDIAALVKESGAKLIGITKYSLKNELSKLTDITLYVSSPEISIRSGAMGSRIAQLTLIDMLFIAVAGKDIRQLQQHILRSYQKAKEHKRD